MGGFVKLHRKTLTSSIWEDPDLFRLWMYCLMKASYKERKLLVNKREIDIGVGQFITGRFSLHQEFNRGVPPRKQVKDTTLWSWLKSLEGIGNIDIKSHSKYSIVTVVNWSLYQETLTTEPQQTDNKLTTKPQQTDTNKNLKKDKNLKKVKNKDIYAENVSMFSEEYEKLVEQFGQRGTNDRIERLNLYKGSTGKKYKSDYMTILNWERKNNPQKGGANNEEDQYGNLF